jgi:signal transduction histidine kinase
MLNISHIVKQSLSYDRVGDASKDLNLSVIVDQSLQAFDEKFQLGGIESKQRVRDGSGILGFLDEVRQVIDRLVSNALQAIPKDGRLGVSVHEPLEWKRPYRKVVRFKVAEAGSESPRRTAGRSLSLSSRQRPEKERDLGLGFCKLSSPNSMVP